MEYLLRTDQADPIRKMIEGSHTDLHVPALCELEVSAALRRALFTGVVDERRALDAIDDYLDLPLSTHGHRALVRRIVALSQNFSAYDATYVALAEHTDAALLTADRALRRAVRQHAPVELVAYESP